jgi:hypothetical protein
LKDARKLLIQPHRPARCEQSVAAYGADFGNLMADSSVSKDTMARLAVGRNYRSAVTHNSNK